MLTIAAAALALAACHQPTPAEIAKAQADQRAAEQRWHDSYLPSVQARLSEINAAFAPCEAADTALNAAGSDLQAVYEAARTGDAVCSAAARMVATLAPPIGTPAEESKLFAEAYDDLSTAAYARASAFENMSKAANDGRLTPALTSSINETLVVSKSKMNSGMSAFAGAAGRAGVPSQELGISQSPS